MIFSEPVRRFLAQRGGGDPARVIYEEIHAHLGKYKSTFPDAEPPFDLEAFASFWGIDVVKDVPLFSEDAELRSESDGSVTIVINPERPGVRRRFNIGHEYTHTLFPGYRRETQCRGAPPRVGGAHYPDLERLCDKGASYLILPDPWFTNDFRQAGISSESVSLLTDRYAASRDAVALRMVQAADEFCVAVCFGWNLTKLQWQELARTVDDASGRRVLEQRKLRVEYFVASHAASQIFVPINKSIDEKSVVSRASRTGVSDDAVERVDLGRFRGTYRVTAVPLYTPPADEVTNRRRVMAILRAP